MKLKNKNLIFIDNCILNRKDFVDIKNFNDYEVSYSLSQLGTRDNFYLINRITGNVIKIKNGKRVR